MTKEIHDSWLQLYQTLREWHSPHDSVKCEPCPICNDIENMDAAMRKSARQQVKPTTTNDGRADGTGSSFTVKIN